MKVDNAAANQAQAAYRTATGPSANVSGVQGQTPGAQAPAKAQRGDMAVISPQGRRYASAFGAVQSTPDVREALVSQIQSQVKSGSYKVDDENIASQLTKPAEIA